MSPALRSEAGKQAGHTDAKRLKIQVGEMDEGSGMAEICQMWQCDGQTGREAARSHELGLP